MNKLRRVLGVVASRRSVLAALAAALAVAAVPAGGQPAPVETRMVTDDLGNEVAIPVRPLRIVALRPEDLTAPLIELGANVVGTVGNVNPAVNGGEPYVQGAYQLLDFRLENSGITFVGTGNNFDIEAIAALQPDLILGSHLHADRRDQLMAIAPTVLIWSGWDDGNTPLEVYRRIADYAGRMDRFAELQAIFNERLAVAQALVAERIPDPSSVTVTILAFDNVTMLTVWRHYWMLTAMLDAIGFAYPEIVETETLTSPVTGRGGDRVYLSAEQLPALDGDFLISIGGLAPGTIADVSARLDAAFGGPEWKTFLHPTQNRQWLFLDSGPARAATFASARWMLDWIVANFVAREFVPRAP
ncbi:MAG: ABC transporter substrate-binding protein [Bauldia sp.]|nr:ABC transporter substrate-binding protein [Bauldia sp.]MCW5718175.1 ABC transporter substrate-binding protein [Bauldia sp.]